MDNSPLSLSRFINDLQARGRYSFALHDIRKLKGRKQSANAIALSRLKRQGRIVSPKRGFYVVVPLEHKSSGSPPAPWFIDDLMRHLSQPYYVAQI